MRRTIIAESNRYDVTVTRVGGDGAFHPVYVVEHNGATLSYNYADQAMEVFADVIVKREKETVDS